MAQAMSRNRQREAFWRRTVREQRRSGLSVREFCRTRQLKEPTFYFWRGELERRQAGPVSGRDRRPHSSRSQESATIPTFVPVRVVEDRAAHQAGRLEVVLAGGQCIRISGRVDRQMLSDVLAVLNSASSDHAEDRSC